MDSLIGAAARALAQGDPLGALKHVALRNDAPALALRGIAMAQLGEFDRAKTLLKSAARAFGSKERVARARCVVAEAEIALVSRDLGWPTKALDAARATLEAHGDRVNAAHARYLAGASSAAARPSRRSGANARGARSGQSSARLHGGARVDRRRHRDAARSRESGGRCAQSRRARGAPGEYSGVARRSRRGGRRTERSGGARHVARSGNLAAARRRRNIVRIEVAGGGCMPSCRARREPCDSARAPPGVVRAGAHAGRRLAAGCSARHAGCQRVSRETRRRIVSCAPARGDRTFAQSACVRSPTSAQRRADSRCVRMATPMSSYSHNRSTARTPMCSHCSRTASGGRVRRLQSRSAPASARCSAHSIRSRPAEKYSRSVTAARGAGLCRPRPDSRRPCYSPLRSRATRMSA